MKCEYNKSPLSGSSYCVLDGQLCGYPRWVWCKGIIIVIFLLGAGFYFLYGLYEVFLTKEDDEIKKNQAQFERLSKDMNNQLDKIKQIPVTVTAYSPRECETDASPFLTAFQVPVEEGIVSVSRDLERLYGWEEGDKIVLAGIGVFKVGDRMNEKWKGRIDIFFFKTAAAKEFGIKKTVGWKI